ncbi:MAG: UDP-N-acetylenolpyruvoylglucosamine reductase [Candidatus Zambryskibacteria bacterium CG22_combo_CG10-13_8_21_14_all_42_17]|uniref:UDP-N-acetylenolpyruvoylglucosamine reductase n=1 Tax=Candidatus Zambryskibacteria bacterium CG22_combo_CG10-13_8_21_14_all_42_17 TaxID=1975118 RepID=A0A2H0BDL2_9BACT|nr:MAG: UDP-N-acetylenolpyruvoylglucosamine reductase [Candidatus Zambryskibacteria bacterium CG22_combo_CG10-13_8_21_14_all_42_17]
MTPMLTLDNVKKNVPLAPYTTYKIGGQADYFFTAHNKSDLVKAVKQSKESKIPFFLLGSGANILIGDRGFRGLVIHNKAENFEFKDNLLIAESGALISDLIVASLSEDLSGLEHYVGIPSTVGGAIRQNLHFLAPDRMSTIFIESVVREGEILYGTREIRVKKDYFKFGYDDSVLHHNKGILVLEIIFELEHKDPKLIRAQMTENMRWRNEKQPQLSEFSSCGSVFKKIKDVGAGRLIDHCGLKGAKIGGAEISLKHANYIVNRGDATASDVRELIDLVQEKVFKETGYHLEPEIGFIGEF